MTPDANVIKLFFFIDEGAKKQGRLFSGKPLRPDVLFCRQGQKRAPRGEHLKWATLRVCNSFINKCKNRLVRLASDNKLTIILITGVNVLELFFLHHC
jgi:hypothetical protein